MLEHHRAYKFEEVINYIKTLFLEKGVDAVFKDNNWCVYAASDIITLTDICYIDEYSDFDDDDENEILPDFIEENDLEFVFREELLQDVIINALEQKPDASLSELFAAINFYSEKDNFMQL